MSSEINFADFIKNYTEIEEVTLQYMQLVVHLVPVTPDTLKNTEKFFYIVTPSIVRSDILLFIPLKFLGKTDAVLGYEFYSPNFLPIARATIDILEFNRFLQSTSFYICNDLKPEYVVTQHELMGGTFMQRIAYYIESSEFNREYGASVKNLVPVTQDVLTDTSKFFYIITPSKLFPVNFLFIPLKFLEKTDTDLVYDLYAYDFRYKIRITINMLEFEEFFKSGRFYICNDFVPQYRQTAQQQLPESYPIPKRIKLSEKIQDYRSRLDKTIEYMVSVQNLRRPEEGELINKDRYFYLIIASKAKRNTFLFFPLKFIENSDYHIKYDLYSADFIHREAVMISIQDLTDIITKSNIYICDDLYPKRTLIEQELPLMHPIPERIQKEREEDAEAERRKYVDAWRDPEAARAAQREAREKVEAEERERIAAEKHAIEEKLRLQHEEEQQKQEARRIQETFNAFVKKSAADKKARDKAYEEQRQKDKQQKKEETDRYEQEQREIRQIAREKDILEFRQVKAAREKAEGVELQAKWARERAEADKKEADRVRLQADQEAFDKSWREADRVVVQPKVVREEADRARRQAEEAAWQAERVRQQAEEAAWAAGRVQRQAEEKKRAEQARAEQARAEQARAEEARARAEQARAEEVRARAEEARARAEEARARAEEARAAPVAQTEDELVRKAKEEWLHAPWATELRENEERARKAYREESRLESDRTKPATFDEIQTARLKAVDATRALNEWTRLHNSLGARADLNKEHLDRGGKLQKDLLFAEEEFQLLSDQQNPKWIQGNREREIDIALNKPFKQMEPRDDCATSKFMLSDLIEMIKSYPTMKRIYHTKARELHPDKLLKCNPEELSFYENKFKILQSTYEELTRIKDLELSEEQVNIRLKKLTHTVTVKWYNEGYRLKYLKYKQKYLKLKK